MCKEQRTKYTIKSASDDLKVKKYHITFRYEMSQGKTFEKSKKPIVCDIIGHNHHFGLCNIARINRYP